MARRRRKGPTGFDYNPTPSRPKMVNYAGSDSRLAGSRFDPPKETNSFDSAALGLMPGESPGGQKINAKPIGNEDFLDEQSLKDFFNSMLALGQEHREPRDRIWRVCFDLYNNEHDFSQRQWWQSRAPIPKVRTAVDRAVSLFRKTLLKTNPFYGMQAESRPERLKGRYTMLLLDYWLDQAKIIENLVAAFKVGLITSTAILKIWWQYVAYWEPEVITREITSPRFEFGVPVAEETSSFQDIEFREVPRGKLGVAPVSPFDLWVIPMTNRRGFIEVTESSLAEVTALAKKGVYEKDAIDRVRQLSSRGDSHSTEKYRNPNEGFPRSSEFLRPLKLWHYHGDIFNRRGELVLPNATFTLVNKEILIRKARPNPFFHKREPYVLGTPYTVPFSTYNRGMVEDVAEIAKNITDLCNLIADGALFDALKAFAIDASTLRNPDEAKGGIYPGKTFIRDGNMSNPNQKTVETIDVGHIPQEAMNMLGLWEKYFQEGSYVNEWVSGQGPRSGGSGRTLGEVQIKTQNALEGLDESARNLEVTLIEPTLELASKVIYQFHEDYRLERLVENYPNISAVLQTMSPAERYAIMVGTYQFQARGLSVMVDRAQRLSEFKEFLQLLSYLPGFIERLNPDTTLEELFQPLGWDVQKLLMSPVDSQVTTPAPGARPLPRPPLPPGNPGGGMISPSGMRPRPMAPRAGGRGMTPMNNRNADEGARMGGSTNNPNAGDPRIRQIMMAIQDMQRRGMMTRQMGMGQ